MDFLLILWILLGLYVGILSAFSFKLFFSDNDKRKLMFGLGLLLSSISFFILGFGFEAYGSSTYLTNLLFHWGPTAYIILLFYILIDLVLREKSNIQLIFKCFLFTLLFSFIVIVSQIIDSMLYGFFMSIGTIIILLFSIYLIKREKNVSSHLFFLSIITILIASYFLSQIDQTTTTLSYLSLFAYFTGYTFIGIIFMVSPLESRSRFGLGSYFSIEKKLEETTKELHETKETFTDLFNQMIDAVVIVNKNGKVLDASQKFFDDLHVEKEDIIGKNFLNTSYFDTSTKKKLIKNMVLRLTGKHIPPYEISVYDKHNRPIPYEIHAGKIIYKGKPAIMAVFRDLTERKRVEKSLHLAETRYKTIFEKTGTAIGTFGDDSIITIVNSEFERLTGYKKEEVVDKKHWYDFIPPQELQRMMKYHKQRSLKNGEPPTSYTSTLIDKQGNEKYIQINIGIIPDTSQRIVSLIDITPLKKMQEQLEQLNKDLEMKVDERTQRIQQLLKQKDEFINQLGHDLKNPLGPLINLLPILEKRENDPKYLEMFHVLNRNVKYMKNLVVKTIKLAKLNSPNTQFHMHAIHLNQLINDVISTNALLFQEKSITVINNINQEILISVDSLQIQELLVNLFTNAVKYSDTNGKIYIESFCNTDEIVISIRDVGKGMTESQLNNIFDEFYKADSSRHDFDSSGLGMPIAKRIVEKHGGRIWAESQGIGKGSTISFSLPLQSRDILDIEKTDLSNNEDVDRKIDLLLSK